MDTLLDSYITLDKFVKQQIITIRGYLECLGLCKKTQHHFNRHFQGKDYILYKTFVDNHRYIRMVEEADKMREITIIPLKKKPFIYIQVIRGNQYLDIYDHIKEYFVEENIINRTLIEFIVFEYMNIDLSNEDYNIHMFTHNAKLKIFDKFTEFNVE